MRFSENMKTFLSDYLEKGWGRQGEIHQWADQLLLFVGINLVTNIFNAHQASKSDFGFTLQWSGQTQVFSNVACLFLIGDFLLRMGNQAEVTSNSHVQDLCMKKENLFKKKKLFTPLGYNSTYPGLIWEGILIICIMIMMLSLKKWSEN